MAWCVRGLQDLQDPTTDALLQCNAGAQPKPEQIPSVQCLQRERILRNVFHLEDEGRVPKWRRQLQNLPAHHMRRLRGGKAEIGIHSEGCSQLFQSPPERRVPGLSACGVDAPGGVTQMSQKGRHVADMQHVRSATGVARFSAVQRAAQGCVQNLRIDTMRSLWPQIVPSKLRPNRYQQPLQSFGTKSSMPRLQGTRLQCAKIWTPPLRRTMRKVSWQQCIRPCRPGRQP